MISKRQEVATKSALNLLDHPKLSVRLRVQLIDLIYRAELQGQESREKKKQRLHEQKLWDHERQLITLKADTTVAGLVAAARKQLEREQRE